jgi:hypothetical protein
MLAEIAKGLGGGITEALEYTFDAVKINLQGMDTEEITTAISEYISGVGDTAVQELFGTILENYQQVGEGLLETATRLITDKEIIVESLDRINLSFAGTGMEAVAFSERIIKLAGDLETFTDAVSTYYDKFFKDGEKHLNLQADLTESLAAVNQILPENREGYRALIEELGKNKDVNAEAIVTLIKLAGYADEYYSYLEDEAAEAARKATDAANELADAQLREAEAAQAAADALAADRQSLLDQIAVLEGTTTARELELAAMDESLRPLQERIWSLQDAAIADEASARAAEEAAEAQVKAAEEAADAIERAAQEAAAKAAEIAQTRQSLQIQILQLSGETAKALAMQRELELSTMDKSLWSLQKRVWNIEDENAAVEKSNILARRRAELEILLLETQGKVTEALERRRALELSDLDPSLRGLMQQIYAAQDAKNSPVSSNGILLNSATGAVHGYRGRPSNEYFEIAGNAAQAAAPGPRGTTVKVYIGNEEFNGRIKTVSDEVAVKRNKRGVNSTRRVYQ